MLEGNSSLMKEEYMNTNIKQINKNFEAKYNKTYFDYVVKSEDSIDSNYFIYVRSVYEPSKFKQLLAYIQFFSYTRVNKTHQLTELELMRVIKEVFFYSRLIIMKTTVYLTTEYTEIELQENYSENHRKSDKIANLIETVEDKALIRSLNRIAKNNGWMRKYEYLIKDEYNIDPGYFLYVRSAIEPLKFKQLLAFIQYTSESHVSSRHRLSEIEAVSIINDLFGHVEILRTTEPLSQDYISINLLENYVNHWKFSDEIFLLVEKIGEHTVITSLKSFAINNNW